MKESLQELAEAARICKEQGMISGAVRPPYKPPFVVIEGAKNSADWNRKRRAAYKKLGLTSRGEPYKYPKHNK